MTFGMLSIITGAFSFPSLPPSHIRRSTNEKTYPQRRMLRLLDVVGYALKGYIEKLLQVQGDPRHFWSLPFAQVRRLLIPTRHIQSLPGHLLTPWISPCSVAMAICFAMDITMAPSP